MNNVDLITYQDLQTIKFEILEEIKKVLFDFKPKGREKKWINTEEAMVLLKVSRATLTNWRVNNSIHAKKVGGKVYFDLDDIKKRLG
ncbi:MAG: helix-turn-helix domain-containing protein [bacterium]